MLHRGCSHALVGARNADQAIADAKAGEVNFNDEELQRTRETVDQTNL
jgi:aryl-alcohol dehydrogenase-like predicted oxidoreductase